jgi:hypothetical protein
MTKILETIGTITGIIGAFLVAFKLCQFGYPCFFASSFCLLISAIKQKQKNYVALQGVFFLANVVGLVNYI